jgi:hypothetical protein
METAQQQLIYPGDEQNLRYWSRKWGVQPSQINEAILQTGSLNPEALKNYLRRDSLVYHPVKGLKHLMRATINYIF